MIENDTQLAPAVLELTGDGQLRQRMSAAAAACAEAEAHALTDIFAALEPFLVNALAPRNHIAAA